MSQAEFKRRLKALMLRPENQVCSDCPERQPRWASLIVPPPGAPPGSLPMGAFCCLECSGSHRRLGVHISFVRSINLDSWKEKEVLAMENGGNSKVNAIFEARLSVSKPTNSASGPVRERFIRDKYERRKFYDPSAFERVCQEEAVRQQEEVVSGVQRRLANTSRQPSDAAKKRVEERAARNRTSVGAPGGGGGVRNTRAIKTPAAPVPVPAPAPAPVVDLLDFGDFDSPEATSAVQASESFSGGGVATSVPATNGSGAAIVSNEGPELDLFANMSIGNNPGEVVANGGKTQQATEQKKMTTADIMSMFNNPTPQHNPMQQNMFAMGGQGGMQNGVGAMSGMNVSNMAMANNMNPQMGMMNNNAMQMMQMQNMMGQQPVGNMGNNIMGGMGNMGMMGGQGGMGNMGGMGGTMNMMQQPQMNNMMMMQGQGAGCMMMQGGGGGGMMMQGGGGNQYGQPMGGHAPASQKQQRGGAHVDQFADFGNFGR